MKKLFFFLAAALVSVSVLAEGHMKFKGVEITGKLPEVVKQLTDKGYTKVSQDKDYVAMYGSFTGQNVVLGVYATPISKTVSRIAVIYPEGGDSWTILSNQYEGLKERLTNKYGEPSEVIEKFEYPYSPTSHPLMAFELEKATYKTRFLTDNGGVTLSIIHYQMTTAVCLLYWDKENEDIMTAELEDEL